MKNITIIVLLIILNLKCSGDVYNNSKENINSKNDTIPDSEIVEHYIDSLNIGIAGKSKIEISKIRVYNNYYLIIKYYSNFSDRWINRNTYMYETYAGQIELNPEIKDFNNDKLNDITIISNEAARGANEIRRLFIYNKKSDELTSIVNSEEFPNLQYNKELNCIYAFAVYGGCSTEFLKIKGDSLKMFASVDLDGINGLYVREYDKNGKEKIIFRDKNDNRFLIQFINYKPLKEDNWKR